MHRMPVPPHQSLVHDIIMHEREIVKNLDGKGSRNGLPNLIGKDIAAQ
jgi:hypothetical protein